MKKKLYLFILLSVVFAVLAVEIINLTKVSLWHDESFSALLIKYNFGEMMDRIKLDVHPPLYYIILRGWSYIFGYSLFSLRAFGVFFGALAIFAFHFFTKKAFDSKGLALFSSILYALSYFSIQYAMEARMYALGTFLLLMAGWFFLKALETRKWNWWLLYALFAAAGIYTHYFAALWLAAQGFYFLYFFWKENKFSLRAWIANKNFLSGLGAYAFIGISFIPWLGTFIRQTKQVEADYWIEKVSIWSIPNTLSKMTTGMTLDTHRFWYLLVALSVLVLLAAFFFLFRNKRAEKWLIVFSVFLPLAIAVLLSLKRSIYTDRYFIFGFPFYALMIAGAVLEINKKWLRRIIVVLLTVGALITFPMQWNGLHAKERPGMAAAAAYLNSQYKPGEKIFVGSSLIYFTLRYYNQTGYAAKLYAPESMPHYSGTALLSPEDIIKDFNRETKPGDTVWMVNTTGFGNWIPQIPANWQKQKSASFLDVYDYRGWILIDEYLVN
jgi:mannosyltransferase